ncbi:hypothetical protein AB4Z29_24880 [Paenibacillus sp. 2TAB23]|uniref:hypothetical protein n=1 Tax=Paenibacillus sp. 2TAB23 TaxID=3233004 RepID=UPI003F9DC284
MTNAQLFTIIISFYAALVSTAVFVWNVVNTLRDRGRIKIGGFFGHSISIGAQSQKILYYEFVNAGGSPVTICNFGGTFKKRYIQDGKSEFIINTPGLPKKLEQGDRFQVTFDEFSSIDERVKTMCIYDTTGKKYKMNNKLLKKLIIDNKTF